MYAGYQQNHRDHVDDSRNDERRVNVLSQGKGVYWTPGYDGAD